MTTYWTKARAFNRLCANTLPVTGLKSSVSAGGTLYQIGGSVKDQSWVPFIFLGCKHRNVDCLNFEIHNRSEGPVIKISEIMCHKVHTSREFSLYYKYTNYTRNPGEPPYYITRISTLELRRFDKRVYSCT